MVKRQEHKERQECLNQKAPPRSSNTIFLTHNWGSWDLTISKVAPRRTGIQVCVTFHQNKEEKRICEKEGNTHTLGSRKVAGAGCWLPSVLSLLLICGRHTAHHPRDTSSPQTCQEPRFLPDSKQCLGLGNETGCALHQPTPAPTPVGQTGNSSKRDIRHKGDGSFWERLFSVRQALE